MTEKPEPIWDPLVRAFHWSLVALVVGGWILGKFATPLGLTKMTLHFYAGYGVAGLIVLRLIWGFVGPQTARWASFIRGPQAVIAYARSLPARQASHTRGHNPLGGWSVVAMLSALTVQIGTGLIADPEDFINIGPLAGMVSAEWNRWALGMHHLSGNIVLALVAFHFGAILFYRIWKREDLVTPMITGYPRDPSH